MLRTPTKAISRRPHLAAAALAALCAAYAACTDGLDVVEPKAEEAPAAILTPGGVRCVASVRAATVACEGPADSTGPAGRSTKGGLVPAALVIGGQDQFVTLTSSNVSYIESSGSFTFDVTVTNLIGQAIGTSDGTAVDSIAVFFASEPVATVGGGDINVFGDGGGTFTASGQRYYRYDEMLAPGETSAARMWQLIVPSSVEAFSFTVYVHAPVQYPDGWIDLESSLPKLILSEPDRLSLDLAPTVHDALGRTVTGATVGYESSAPGVATVDEVTGRVDAVAAGTTTITATSSGGAPTGTFDVAVLDSPPAADSAMVELADAEITADGTSQTTVTVTVLDVDGDPVFVGGDSVTLEITPINTHTPGGTLSGVTDNADGTYTATLTAPTDNGTGVITASFEGAAVDTAIVTYTGGNSVPTAGADTVAVLIAEDTPTELTLPGADADGDPLTYHIIELYRRNGYPGTTFENADGVIDEGDDLDDPTFTFTPHEDGSATELSVVTYTVTDGLSVSDTVRLRIDVHSVNDAPRLTLEGTKKLWEEGSLDFTIGGNDIELDQYRVLIVVPPLARGFLVHHHFTGDIVINGQATLQSVSDQSNGWPMSFTPTPDDYDAVWYNSFSYVLEEINSGLRSEEGSVDFVVLPVNDAPEMEIDGVGKARDHDLATTAVEGGRYALPALAVTDRDMGQHSDSTFTVTIESSGNGTISLETSSYEDAFVVFDWTVGASSDTTAVTFTMEPDMSEHGFVSGLTLDSLLNTLRYTPGTAGADTLTITIDDNGNLGSCTTGDVNSPPGPCSKTSVTAITVDIETGTPPADGTVLTLAPAGG